jgi:hypothetical protein
VPAALWYQTVRVVKGLIPKLDVVRERMDPAPSGDVVVFRPAGSGNFARRVLGGFRCRGEVANASSALWVGPGFEIIAGSSTKTEFGDIVASNRRRVSALQEMEGQCCHESVHSHGAKVRYPRVSDIES